MVVACAPNKCINTKTAAQALANHDWVRDIKCGLSQEELSQFLQLWNILGDIELSMDQDRHIWKHEASGSFSIKSATEPSSMVQSLSNPGWKASVEILGPV